MFSAFATTFMVKNWILDTDHLTLMFAVVAGFS